MADAVLGLGSAGSAGLNEELITKLKVSEMVAVVDPIVAQIENNEMEIGIVDEVELKVLELLETVEAFDLYTSGTSAFNEITATTSGESVSFDAVDTSKLEPGIINVSINQLAQKDAYQSDIISDKDQTLPAGTLELEIDGEVFSFETEDKTYDELIEELNFYEAIDASLEQISDSTYRMVIKSNESGEKNAIIFNSDVNTLNFQDPANHVLTSQNMKASVDGIDYELSENKINLGNGLTIDAISVGDSSITLKQDTSTLVTSIEEIAIKYNELVSLIDSNIYGDEDNPSNISDSSTLKNMMNSIKGIFFDTYGLEDEESIFAYGISFDSDGYIQIDSEKLANSVSDNYDDLEELFVGYAEKEGVGTRLKTYLDSLDGFDGLLTSYDEKLSEKDSSLKEEKEKAIKKIDEKYNLMTQEFAFYTVMITQMENQFASLGAIINQE